MVKIYTIVFILLIILCSCKKDENEVEPDIGIKSIYIQLYPSFRGESILYYDFEDSTLFINGLGIKTMHLIDDNSNESPTSRIFSLDSISFAFLRDSISLLDGDDFIVPSDSTLTYRYWHKDSIVFISSLLKYGDNNIKEMQMNALSPERKRYIDYILNLAEQLSGDLYFRYIKEYYQGKTKE